MTRIMMLLLVPFAIVFSVALSAHAVTITTFSENNVGSSPPAIPFPGKQLNSDLPSDFSVVVGPFDSDNGFLVQGLTSSGGDDSFQFSFAPSGGGTFDVSIQEQSQAYVFVMTEVGGNNFQGSIDAGDAGPNGLLFDDIAFGTFNFLLDGQGGSGVQYHILFSPSSAANGIPEPGTIALLSVGLVGFGIVRRRKATKHLM